MISYDFRFQWFFASRSLNFKRDRHLVVDSTQPKMQPKCSQKMHRYRWCHCRRCHCCWHRCLHHHHHHEKTRSFICTKVNQSVSSRKCCISFFSDMILTLCCQKVFRDIETKAVQQLFVTLFSFEYPIKVSFYILIIYWPIVMKL
jgi:hypothetical protein